MYDGSPIVKASQGNVIYVAGNYRLAAFGFLAGSSVEKDGTPNAGLWDQRATLQWIQDYSALFGADIENVSVWVSDSGGGTLRSVHLLTSIQYVVFL
jgi:carboxylesterase type B